MASFIILILALILCSLFLGARPLSASCQTSFVSSSSSPFIEDNQENTTLKEIGFEEVVSDVYSSCKSPTVVLISDDNEYVDIIWNHFTKYSMPMIQRDEGLERPQELKAWLKDVYIEHTDATFVVLLQNPARLLETVDSLSTNQTLPEISMIRHNSKWLVFCWTDEQSEGVTRQQFSSVLDNVAVVRISKEQREGIVSTKILSVTTFIWNSNRNRLPHNVTFLEGGRECFLFPNRKFGMNGRTLKVLTKVFYESVLTLEKNHDCNCSEYKGTLITLIEFLSRSLNFTFILYPATEDVDRLNWAEYQKLLDNGTCDLGLNIWPDIYAKLGKNSVTYPVIFDVVTGLYRIPPYSERNFSTSILFPFPNIIYLYIGLCLLAAAGLYIITILSIRGKVVPDKHSSSYVPGCIVVALSFVDISWRFLSSLFLQNYFPNPWQMSSRILVGIWSLTVIILYAVHTGYVTANLITRSQGLPFVTFHQMVATDDYRWASTNNTLLLSVFDESKKSILREVGSLMQKLPTSQSETAYSTVDRIMSSNEDRFVFLYYDMALQYWLERQVNPESYYIMKSVLVQTNGGLLLMKGSELEHVLSLKVLEFHEAGFLQQTQSILKMHKSYIPNAKPPRVLGINNFFWPFIFVVYSAAIALVVLVGELVVKKFLQPKIVKRE